jgi:hypothetical protein
MMCCSGRDSIREFPAAVTMTKAVKGFVMPEVRRIVVYGNEMFVCGACVKESDGDSKDDDDEKTVSFSLSKMRKHQSQPSCVRKCEYDEAKIKRQTILNNKKVSACMEL